MRIEEALGLIVRGVDGKRVREADKFARSTVTELLGEGSDVRIIPSKQEGFCLFVFSPGPFEGLHKSMTWKKVNITT